MSDDSLYLPLNQMKKDNPLIAACLHSVFVGKEELVEGFTRLDDVEDTFVISATKNYIEEEKFTVTLEMLKKGRCGSNTVVTVTFVSLLILLIIMILVVGIWDCRNKRKNDTFVTEDMDINPDYGAEGYDDGVCEVNDVTDYYFDEDNQDTAEITDVNEYYNSDEL
jgi:hypothetical protein